MASKGNPKVTIRFTKQEVEEMWKVVDRVNATRSKEPYTMAEWIRNCVKERLRKLSYKKPAKATTGREVSHEQHGS